MVVIKEAINAIEHTRPLGEKDKKTQKAILERTVDAGDLMNDTKGTTPLDYLEVSRICMQ